MDILQDDKYWKHELNIQSRGSKSQNIIKFQELVMHLTMERKIKLVFDVTRRLNYYIISILFIVIYIIGILPYIAPEILSTNLDKPYPYNPLDFSVEDNSYSSSEMMNGSLKLNLYN
uniref:Uncharacterized protein n=1 Tax=Rhizophagus irregularis (strain DAOM 181602 / DAOM 197198 / MUCL 43194) TaxID=747089 RepID=U9T7M8_RHIID